MLPTNETFIGIKYTTGLIKLSSRYVRQGNAIITRTYHVNYDDVIKWKHFPRYWPFVRGIHRSLVYSPHKGQWRGVLLFSLICARLNDWVNNREAGDLRHHRAHYDDIVKKNIVFRINEGLPVCNLFCTDQPTWSWWLQNRHQIGVRPSGTTQMIN